MKSFLNAAALASIIVFPVVNAGKNMMPSIIVEASGAQESPSVDTMTMATMILGMATDLSMMTFEIDVMHGIGITQGHLHCALAGVGGPVVTTVIDLKPLNDTMGEDFCGKIEGEIMDKDIMMFTDDAMVCGVEINNIASLYEAILQRKIYLNIHSVMNKSGEVRGQVLKDFMMY